MILCQIIRMLFDPTHLESRSPSTRCFFLFFNAIFVSVLDEGGKLHISVL